MLSIRLEVRIGGGVQTNPNLPTIAHAEGEFNPYPARTLLLPPRNPERGACSASLRLSSFYIHINLHLILNSPTLTQIFCSPIQFTSLGLIQKHTSFTAYTHTPTPASALSIARTSGYYKYYTKGWNPLFALQVVGISTGYYPVNESSGTMRMDHNLSQYLST